MLVSTDTFDGLKWIAIALFVVSIIAGVVFVPKNIEPYSDRAKKVRRVALMVIAFIIVVAVMAFGLEPFATSVVIVKIAASGEVEKTRASLFGARNYEFQDHHIETMRPGRTTIVNDSTQQMRVAIASYGDATMALTSSLLDAPDKVPPMTITAVDHSVDFVGPDDPPPHEVQGTYSEKRYWLEW